MRAFVFLMIPFLSTAAFANPFDSFIGKYKISGKPQMRNSDAVQCRKFELSGAKSLEVVASPDTRSGRTHLVRVVKSEGGASTFSISEYNYDSGFSEPILTEYRASIDGRAPNFAMNSVVIDSDERTDFAQLSLGRPGGKIELRISQQHEENSNYGYRRWTCEFIAQFRK